MSRIAKPPIFDPFAIAVSDGSDPDLFAPPTYMDTGFPAPGDVPVVPKLGDFNWLEFMNQSFGRYLVQRGITDWDTNEDSYDVGDIVRDITDKKFYVLRSAATVAVEPHTDPAWELWLASPNGLSGDFVKAVWAWGNSKRHAGHIINHQGILDGRILTIEEDWIDVGGETKGIAPDTGPWFGRWNFGIFGQGGNVFASPPATDLGASPWGPRAGVTIIGGAFPFAQSSAIIEMCRGVMFGGSAYLSMEAALSVNPNGAGTIDTADTFSFGFSNGTLVAAASVAPCDTAAMASNAGAYLVKLTGGTNWTVVSRPVGGGGASTTTGVTVALGSPLRYRVEVVHSGAADDSAVHVIHYINGAIVANHAVDMSGAMLTPFLRTAGQYSGPNVHSVLNVGRIRLTGRLELGNVSI